MNLISRLFMRQGRLKNKDFYIYKYYLFAYNYVINALFLSFGDLKASYEKLRMTQLFINL